MQREHYQKCQGSDCAQLRRSEGDRGGSGSSGSQEETRKKALEVLQNITDEDRARTKELIENGFCTCSLKEGVANLFIEVRAEGDGNQASVRLEHEHTNITYITRNGKDDL